MNSFAGGCVCGAIRYECTSKPILMFNCHCRDCQHVTGSAFAPVIYVAADTFKLTKGTLHHHLTESYRGGQHKRGFCAECGSRISGGEGGGGIGFLAGSLDDPSQFVPTMDIHVADAQPWDHLDPSLEKCEGYPPM